ncbi:hypothetical protein [Aestuariibaculum marinum]|uniref:Uncharacterized protein n=1 Tax=Aestuariibaculum marinum TaxID=2683592 RepID=A0A8J6PYN0_9FLAO|nr:hypothetical protein [Aestuariibaculum marinum]MBD0822662.1 hypothetical protein [Aestuariibaculum marinum]
MTDKVVTLYLTCYDLCAKAFPYLVGLAVNFLTFQEALLRVVVTCISMLSGAVFVHYLKPIVVKRIDRLKKKPK